MCFDHDSRPPIAPIAGGALDSSRLTLTAADGTRFSAFRARAAKPSGAGIIVLPDVRGLHAFYEELALRLAEAGIDALAVDYFARTAGQSPRGEDFEYAPHVAQTTYAGLTADIVAAAAELRRDSRVRSLFTVGFCFGGRLAFLTSTLNLELAGAIGFYGNPVGAGRNDMPAPVDAADRMTAPILGLFGDADQGIPPSSVEALQVALDSAGVENRLVTYPDAPHSFFDRKAGQFAQQSADAWRAVLDFVRDHTRAA